MQDFDDIGYFDDIADLEQQHKEYANAEKQYRDEFKRFWPVRKIMFNPKNFHKDPYKVCLNNEQCRNKCYANPKCDKNVTNYRNLYDDYAPHYNNNNTFDNYIYDKTKELKDEVDDTARKANKKLENIQAVNNDVNHAAEEVNQRLRENVDAENDDDNNNDDLLAELDGDNAQHNEENIVEDINNNDDLLVELDDAIVLDNVQNINHGRRSRNLDKIAKECARRLSKRNKH